MTTEIIEREVGLATIPEERAKAVFIDGAGIDELLAACEERALSLVPDVETAKGRAEIKSMAYLVTRTKTTIDAVRKALADEYKEIPKRIDANGKRLRDGLDALQERVRMPLTTWEAVEAAKLDALKARVDAFRTAANVSLETAKDVADWIEHVNTMEIDDSYGQMRGDAAIAKDAALARLRERHAAAVSKEAADNERRERERQEMQARAEREAQDRVAREKLELENQALRAKAAQEKAERDAAQAIADAERREKEAVENERRRVESETLRLKQAEDKRIADIEHRQRVHSEIQGYMVEQGLDDETAEMVVSVLSLGDCPHVVIRY